MLAKLSSTQAPWVLTPEGSVQRPQKPLMVQPLGYPVIGNLFQEATCKCDGDTFGHYCEHSKDPCDEQCFPNVKCIQGSGCEACPPDMTGDGHHCAGE
jgi:hypothetical protein